MRLSRRESFESLLDAAGGMKLGSLAETGGLWDPMCLSQHIHRRMLGRSREAIRPDSLEVNSPVTEPALIDALELTANEQLMLARLHNAEVYYRIGVGESFRTVQGSYGNMKSVVPVPDLTAKLKRIVSGEKVAVRDVHDGGKPYEFDIAMDWSAHVEAEAKRVAALHAETQRRQERMHRESGQGGLQNLYRHIAEAQANAWSRVVEQTYAQNMQAQIFNSNETVQRFAQAQTTIVLPREVVAEQTFMTDSTTFTHLPSSRTVTLPREVLRDDGTRIGELVAGYFGVSALQP